jgi:hypothetical protein
LNCWVIKVGKITNKFSYRNIFAKPRPVLSRSVRKIYPEVRAVPTRLVTIVKRTVLARCASWRPGGPVDS